MATYEILIADDHPLFRSALHQAVTLGLGPDVRLVEVASIAELEARYREQIPDDSVAGMIRLVARPEAFKV